jgi:arabinogalactan oligomer / maltooligosaccharide transport system substrate-binding protein
VLTLFLQEEIQVELALASGCAPAKEACYELDSIMSDEVVMAMKETAEHAIPMPNVPEMDVMWTVVGNLLTDINMRGEDVSESATKAQNEALQLIENMQ